MKRFSIVWMIVAAGGMLSFDSCLKQDFDAPPDISGIDPDLPVNLSIQQLKAMMPPSGVPQFIDSSFIIYGIVTADDRSGNFYKQINIEDSTGGITILINQTSLYTKLPVGRKLYVKLKGLYYGFYGGLPQLGFLDNGDLGQIPASVMDSFLVRADFPHDVVPDTVSLSDVALINTHYLNRLIAITDVAFDDNELGKTYAQDPNTTGQSGTDRYIRTCSGNFRLNVRTSNYAGFRDVKLPSGSGSITGVYTVYNGKPQFMVRDTGDVHFYNARCEDSTDAYFFEEGFNQATSGAVAIAGWQNIAAAGSQKWLHSDAGSAGNPYVRISAFNSDEAAVESWLISPAIDLSGAESPVLTFRTLSAYDNGATLEIFYTTNFTGNVATTTWTALPAAVSHNPDGFSGVSWMESGSLSLPASEIYIGFKYAGSDPSKTTTYEMDDVKISGG